MDIAYKNWEKQLGKSRKVKKINFLGYVLTRHNMLYRFRDDGVVYVAERWECLTEDEELKEFIFRSEYIDEGDEIAWNYTELSDTQNYCTVPNAITDYRAERLKFEKDGSTIYMRGFNRRHDNIFLDEKEKEVKLRIRAFNALLRRKYLPAKLRNALKVRRELEMLPSKKVLTEWNFVEEPVKKLAFQLLYNKIEKYAK